MLPQAVFLDMDGTLISKTKHEIPDSAIMALQKLQQKNVRCIICTGRTHYEMMQADLKGWVPDAIILQNGMVCHDHNGKELFFCSLSAQQQQTLMDLYTSCRFPMMLIGKDWSALNYENDLVRLVQKEINITLDRNGTICREKICMGMMYGDRKLMEQMKAEISGFVVESWCDHCADLISEHHGKKEAMEKYCQQFNLDLQRCAAIGDGDNDALMLQAAGVGVCMAKGSKRARKAADYMAPDVDEDGLYEAFLKLGWLQDEKS